jgi:hypothetical protein
MNPAARVELPEHLQGYTVPLVQQRGEQRPSMLEAEGLGTPRRGPQLRGGNAPSQYVNRNPKASPGEVRLGELLHGEAQGGKLKGIRSVEGAAESGVPGVRSGDYRFTLADGRVISADRYAPTSGRIENIADSVMQKSGQAEVVVIELGGGRTAAFGAAEARQIAQRVFNTPGHGIQRVIVVKDGTILVDLP